MIEHFPLFPVAGTCIFLLFVGCCIVCCIWKRNIKSSGCCSKKADLKSGPLQATYSPDDQSYEPMSGLNASLRTYKNKFMTRTLFTGARRKTDYYNDDVYETMEI